MRSPLMLRSGRTEPRAGRQAARSGANTNSTQIVRLAVLRAYARPNGQSGFKSLQPWHAMEGAPDRVFQPGPVKTVGHYCGTPSNKLE